mgnify:CR=1 FL=1
MSSLADERAALRSRQGAGARHDAATAPAADLDLARRGNAQFARLVSGLSDPALAESSALAGQSRRQIIARIALEARLLATALGALRESGTAAPALPLRPSESEVAFTATLPSEALRHLLHHATIHLDVEWRDTTEAGWERVLRTPDGQETAVRAIPRLRAGTIWQATLDLRAGGRERDLPPALRGEIGADQASS